MRRCFWQKQGLRLRSVGAHPSPVWTGPREQMNLVSAFLDGSALYGTDKHTAKRVRSYSGGRLRLNADDTLPRSSSSPCVSERER